MLEERKEFGKRPPSAEPTLPSETPKHLDPELLMKILRGKKDPELNGLLDDVVARIAQQRVDGVHEDTKVIDGLILNINKALERIGQRPIERKDLP